MNGTGQVDDGYTAQERAALVTYQLVSGAEMSTAEIAERTGLSRAGAWHMMNRVSRVVPLYQDGGRWRRLE